MLFALKKKTKKKTKKKDRRLRLKKHSRVFYYNRCNCKLDISGINSTRTILQKYTASVK